MNPETNTDLKQQYDADKYSPYVMQYDPDAAADLLAGTHRLPRKPKRGKSSAQAVADLAEEAAGLEAGFQTTYRPGPYETDWLVSSLRSFYEQALITDVMAQVRGGKEANVYRCAGHPSTHAPWLAAKVYRPRKFRNLRNDKMYREGRIILATDGRPAKPEDQRIMRALEKGTAFGQQLTHTSWLMYEHTTLEKLYKAGAAVPKPYGASENGILMAYIGDEQMAAPTLATVDLPLNQAQRLLTTVLENVELMLTQGLIHGDLSAYNLLYWHGQVTLIDFPQVVDSHENRHAQAILQRDITRICDYFQQWGVRCNSRTIAHGLWQRYAAPDPLDVAADWSRIQDETTDEE